VRPDLDGARLPGALDGNLPVDRSRENELLVRVVKEVKAANHREVDDGRRVADNNQLSQ
jgi:hypothetical protein